MDKVLKEKVFDDGYKVCGGRIALLKDYFSEYIIWEGKLTPENFNKVGYIKQKFWKLKDGIYNEQNQKVSKWTEDDFWKMMELFVSKRWKGIIPYQKLCEQVSSAAAVDSLIEYYVLQYRP